MENNTSLQELNNITKNLILEINYIIRHINRDKLTRNNIRKLQTIRDDLERDLIYYNFIVKTNNSFGLNDLIKDKKMYLNQVSININNYKRIIQ